MIDVLFVPVAGTFKLVDEIADDCGIEFLFHRFGIFNG